MKLSKLNIKNFRKMSDVTIEFSDGVTNIVGYNKGGKSTVVAAIHALFRGVGATGEMLLSDRFRVIGDGGETAEIIGHLVDTQRGDQRIEVKRTITETENKIKFTVPKGYPISESWFRELLSVVFLSPKNFLELKPIEQSEKLGINTGSFDLALKGLKEEATAIRRDIKNLGEIVEVPAADPVLISELMDEKEKALNFNTAQDNKANVIESKQIALKDRVDEVRRLQEQITAINKDLSVLPPPLLKVDTQGIQSRLYGAEETNKKVAEYKEYIKKKAKEECFKESLADNKVKQDKVSQDKTDYLATCKMGLEGIEINENGELVYNGFFLKELSKGEQMDVVARLHAAGNPELKTIILDDFETLDEINQEKTVTALLELGFQVITLEVGERKKDENTIIMRECRVL